MRITDIINEADSSNLRNFIRGANKGVTVDPQDTDRDDDSEHGDIRDLAATNKIGSFTKGKLKKISQPNVSLAAKNRGDITKPLYKNNPVTWNSNVYSFYSELDSDGEKYGYEVTPIQTYHGMDVGITTKVNNIEVTFALNTGKRLPSTFRIGVPKGKSKEETEEKSKDLLNGLHDAGYKTYIPPGDQRISITVDNSNTRAILEKFWEVVKSVEDMGEDFKTTKTLSKVASKLQKKQAPFRYYLGAASLIYVAVKFNLPNVLPRGGGEKSTSTFDINDNLLAQGYSQAAAELMKAGRGTWDKKNNDGIWREHPVPCDLIIKKAVDMIKERRTGKVIDEEVIGEVAKMIQRNLMIVWITKDEADLLDNQLGLKTTMPQGDGWDPFNDDPLSRLKAGGIRVYSADAGVRLRENKK
jgi:hypothetical protein